ncbi:hypothetical protein KR200_005895, partial [Drosophila serrata]
MYTIIFKTLSEDQHREVLEWLREKNADSPKVRRQFSDVYPLAEILQRDFPRQIDLVNYPKRNRISLKTENWEAFNFKFLSRHNMSLHKNFIELLAKGSHGAIEVLIYELIRLRKQQERRVAKRQDQIASFEKKGADTEHDEDAKGLEQDAQSHDKAKPVEQDNVVQVTSRMILFTRYEELARECQAKDSMITMYEHRVKHLERACQSMKDELQQISAIVKKLPE